MCAWLEQMFSAAQVSKGGLVRRQLYDVLRLSSLAEVRREAERRGFHVFINGDQVVVACNDGDFRILC
jgi:hypothetical protein